MRQVQAISPTGMAEPTQHEAADRADPWSAHTEAYIGLGANLGDASSALTQAVQHLACLPDSRLAGLSSLWQTAPVQATGPDFINAVARLQTGLTPQALLGELQRIEQAFGRERPYPNAPRTLDLDLLLQGDVVLDTGELTLPHPRMHLRAFVLAPLAELAPDLPVGTKGSVRQLLAACTDQPIRCLGPIHQGAAHPASNGRSRDRSR
jgi:2-amino-4-hydroxy-6-hydroxymethyldihydropteridine diphosphokinase